MCGRYTVTADREQLAERFDASVPEWHEPRYNCAPGQSLPIVTDGGTIVPAEWGFVPPDDRDTDDEQAYINARGETIDERRAFADAFAETRCLVPTDGFYVWRTEGDERVPYRVSFPDGRLFAVAGIYAEWTESTRQAGLGEFGDDSVSDGTERRRAFAIVTKPAPPWLEEYHHRGDVIVPPAEESTWLADGVDVASDVLESPLPEQLTVSRVSKRVNDASTDDPSLLEQERTASDDESTNHEL